MSAQQPQPSHGSSNPNIHRLSLLSRDPALKPTLAALPSSSAMPITAHNTSASHLPFKLHIGHSLRRLNDLVYAVMDRPSTAAPNSRPSVTPPTPFSQLKIRLICIPAPTSHLHAPPQSYTIELSDIWKAVDGHIVPFCWQDKSKRSWQANFAVAKWYLASWGAQNCQVDEAFRRQFASALAGIRTHENFGKHGENSAAEVFHTSRIGTEGTSTKGTGTRRSLSSGAMVMNAQLEAQHGTARGIGTAKFSGVTTGEPYLSTATKNVSPMPARKLHPSHPDYIPPAPARQTIPVALSTSEPRPPRSKLVQQAAGRRAPPQEDRKPSHIPAPAKTTPGSNLASKDGFINTDTTSSSNSINVKRKISKAHLSNVQQTRRMASSPPIASTASRDTFADVDMIDCPNDLHHTYRPAYSVNGPVPLGSTISPLFEPPEGFSPAQPDDTDAAQVSSMLPVQPAPMAPMLPGQPPPGITPPIYEADIQRITASAMSAYKTSEAPFSAIALKEKAHAMLLMCEAVNMTPSSASLLYPIIVEVDSPFPNLSITEQAVYDIYLSYASDMLKSENVVDRRVVQDFFTKQFANIQLQSAMELVKRQEKLKRDVEKLKEEREVMRRKAESLFPRESARFPK